MFPRYEDVELALFIEILQRNGTAEPKEVYQPLAKRFNLSPKDLDEETKEKMPRNKWENIIRFAVKGLREKGLVDHNEYGVWRLTEKGNEINNGKECYPITKNIKVRIKVWNRCLEIGLSETKSLESVNLTKAELKILLPQI